jgi:hypothetical protein
MESYNKLNDDLFDNAIVDFFQPPSKISFDNEEEHFNMLKGNYSNY